MSHPLRSEWPCFRIVHRLSPFQQRAVVCLYDGFGYDYYERSPLPVMKRMAAEGMARRGFSVFPTLTNANTVSVCCATWLPSTG
jgi:predicted AlkP superfamily pyrophosphatase or phosphodiesterase